MRVWRYQLISRGVGALGAAAALAACAPATVPQASQPPMAGSPVPASSAATGAATPAAAPTPSALTSMAPSTPTPAGGTVSGALYDLDSAPLEGASVQVRSLDPSVPFEMPATMTPGGHYALTGLPVATNLEVLASKPGFTTRRRVLAVARDAVTLDFGTPKSGCTTGAACDAQGYFLSNLPEVTLTSPVTDGPLADPLHFHFELALSTPLDATNRNRFANALRIIPADEGAQGGDQGFTSLAETEDKGFPADRDLIGVGSYQIRVGTLFRAETATAATLSWNEAGTHATFDFGGPPLTGRHVPARYQIALAAGQAPIVDTLGHPLGTDAAGSFKGYPAPGHLVHSVFQSADLRLFDIPGLAPLSREARWAATHDDAGRFSVAPYDFPPHLVGVSAATVNGDTRLSLYFDRPLAAFDQHAEGRVGVGLDPTKPLMNFTFALSTHLNDLAGLMLTGRDVATVDPRSVTSFGGLEGDRKREFQFAQGAFVTTGAAAPTGSVLLGADPSDPRRATFTIFNRPHFFDSSIVEFAARVEGLGDPLGHVVTRDDADNHLYRGTL